MSDYLVIVESPAKAKTIERYLGKKYKVKASVGHVRDLPRSQMGIDTENNYEPKYITIRGKGPVLQELKTAAKKAKKVYLAADPDREGEAIAWHLATALNIDIHSDCRVVFNEITKEAILESFKKTRANNMDFFVSQQAKRILDSVGGYNISPILWKKVKKGLSAGRVQSVAMRLIIDRENEIQNFQPEEYWTIEGAFEKGKKTFEAMYYGNGKEKVKLTNETQVNDILKNVIDDTFQITSVVKKERKRNAAPSFTTSSLQQEAARKLNFRAKKTMMLAQQLYEGIDIGKKKGTVGLITYMRTDSTRVSESAKAEAIDYIQVTYGQQYVAEETKQAKKATNAQEAHEAIRPTSAMRTPEQLKEVLSRDQLRLYKLIWDRFIASQMSPAILDTVTVELQNGDVQFRANGSQVKFAGFMKVYVEDTDDKATEETTKLLPEMAIGDVVKALEIVPKQHFTQPPPRYSEARLVKTLEELGIGRPSTYAPTIDTIQKRGYVSLDNKRFVPTELGEIVHQQMLEFFPGVINIEFTAKMEQDLDHIEDGDIEWKKVIDSFYREFEKDVKYADAEMEKIVIKDEPAGEDCEKCGSPMVFKLGRFGKFMACSNFPDCRNTKAIVKLIGVKCPSCETGEIVERKSKTKRLFYGCNHYPECDFVSWDKPISRPCPKCSALLVEKKLKKGVQIQCTKCDYEEDTTQ